MNEKIKSALKTKYANKGFSEEVFDGVASLASITVTEESQIDAFVNGAEAGLTKFQSETDRRVNKLQGENTQLQSDKSELEKKLGDQNTPPATPPAELKGNKEMLELIQGLKDEVKNLKDARTQDIQLQSQDDLKLQAKKLMVEKGVKESSCDEILSTIDISEGETAETLTTKGVDKNNKWQAMYTPEAGNVQTPQGNEDFNTALDDFFKGVNPDAD